MNGVKTTWQYAKEEHIPPDTFAKIFVDELGKIVGLMKIYGWTLYLKMIKEMEEK